MGFVFTFVKLWFCHLFKVLQNCSAVDSSGVPMLFSSCAIMCASCQQCHAYSAHGVFLGRGGVWDQGADGCPGSGGSTKGSVWLQGTRCLAG